MTAHPTITASPEPFALVQGLADATPTAARKVATARSTLGTMTRDEVSSRVHETPTVEIPGVDTAALSRQYHDYGTKPTWHEGTFQVPLDVTWARYEHIRDDAMKRFLSAYARKGWEPLVSNAYRPRVSPGIYPAHDLRDGIALLDRREFIVGAWFVHRTAKPIRVELPSHLVQPLTLQR